MITSVLSIAFMANARDVETRIHKFLVAGKDNVHDRALSPDLNVSSFKEAEAARFFTGMFVDFCEDLEQGASVLRNIVRNQGVVSGMRAAMTGAGGSDGDPAPDLPAPYVDFVEGARVFQDLVHSQGWANAMRALVTGAGPASDPTPTYDPLSDLPPTYADAAAAAAAAAAADLDAQEAVPPPTYQNACAGLIGISLLIESLFPAIKFSNMNEDDLQHLFNLSEYFKNFEKTKCEEEAAANEGICDLLEKLKNLIKEIHNSKIEEEAPEIWKILQENNPSEFDNVYGYKLIKILNHFKKKQAEKAAAEKAAAEGIFLLVKNPHSCIDSEDFSNYEEFTKIHKERRFILGRNVNVEGRLRCYSIKDLNELLKKAKEEGKQTIFDPYVNDELPVKDVIKDLKRLGVVFNRENSEFSPRQRHQLQMS